jgi:hypothetical protein
LAAVLVSGVFLFSGYLKWQEWHTRRHLAFLLLFMPLVSWVLVRKASPWGPWLTAVVVQVFACYSIASNMSCPIFNAHYLSLPRERQYAFVHHNSINEALKRLTDTIVAAKCKNVGLKLGYDAAEYPIWVMLKNRGFDGTIQHTYVENESASIPSTFSPDVIISILPNPPEAVRREFPYLEKYGEYTVLWREKPVSLEPRSASLRSDARD